MREGGLRPGCVGFSGLPEASETFPDVSSWPGLMPLDSHDERCWRCWPRRAIVFVRSA